MKTYMENGGETFETKSRRLQRMDKTVECSKHKSLVFTGARAYNVTNPTTTSNIHSHYTSRLYNQPMNESCREMCKFKRQNSTNCPIKDAAL